MWEETRDLLAKTLARAWEEGREERGERRELSPRHGEERRDESPRPRLETCVLEERVES
jgi:hypothetical protein